eukprot:1519759-Rhodomonas_salina.1
MMKTRIPAATSTVFIYTTRAHNKENNNNKKPTKPTKSTPYFPSKEILFFIAPPTHTATQQQPILQKLTAKHQLATKQK